MNNNPEGLLTLDENGNAPETRMKEPSQVQEFARKLAQADSKRAKKRALVSGLVGGKQPYNPAKLKDAGRADACNVNFGTSRMYLESGTGAYYDLFNEAPGRVSIATSYGTPEERLLWSQIMSKEADRILANDKTWDFEMQQSQEQMVLHGRGPLMFEDTFKVLPRSFHDGAVRVPEMTKADTTYWDACTVDVDYYPPQLYEFIKNEKAAKNVGWNVSHVKAVLANAVGLNENQQPHPWEHYQQELKNNSLSYEDESKICKLAFVYWKEFSGKITQAIVERESNTKETQFLFFLKGRYNSWTEAIHPMYMDRGHGGFHHSVTGLGVKMFGAMEYENRLLCNLMDKAFAPKILFRPTSAEAKEKINITPMGDWGTMPAGWDVQQVPIQGFLNDGLAIWRASTDLMRSNLSSYRQQTPMKESGNPATAKEVALRASESSTLSRPTYQRYYKQLDLVYAEVVRRMCLKNSTDERAKEFQKRCLDQGVDEKCFTNIDTVAAVRVVGQGNPFMREQTMMELMPFIQRLPEDGQLNLMNDLIACKAGHAQVERYNPQANASRLPSDQQFEALQGVAMMKVGVPPIVTSTQNPVIYAKTYLTAGSQALASLQQGANPQEVYAFLSMCGPAVLAQLQRFQTDPLRAQAFQTLFEQWQKMAALTDKLRAKIEGDAQAQQAQQAKTQQTLSDEQIKMMKAQNAMQIQREKMDLAKEKHQQQLETAAQGKRQELVLKDATTASEIQRKNTEAQAAIERAEAESKAMREAQAKKPKE